jgi:hypothetical protein
VLNQCVLILTQFFAHQDSTVRVRTSGPCKDHCDRTPPEVYVVVWQIRTLAVQAMNLVIVLKPTQLALSMEGFIQVRQALGPPAFRSAVD